MLNILSYAYLPSLYLLWKSTCCNILSTLFFSGCLFPYCWVLMIFIYSGYNSFVKNVTCNIFSSSGDYVFTLLTMSCAKQKLLILMISNLSFIFLLWIIPLLFYLKTPGLLKVTKIFSYASPRSFSFCVLHMTHM